MGLPVGYHTYKLYGEDKQNVYAWQTGAVQPNREFLIVGHLDSYSPLPYSLAPGADDNASGSAGVLETASILRQYAFGCTMRYVLFTGEEQGMIGSAAFAQDLADEPGIQVAGVLNLDMIAYDSNAVPTVELHVRTEQRRRPADCQPVSAGGLSLRSRPFTCNHPTRQDFQRPFFFLEFIHTGHPGDRRLDRPHPLLSPDIRPAGVAEYPVFHRIYPGGCGHTGPHGMPAG